MRFEFLELKAINFVLYKSLKIDFTELEGNLIFITGKNFDVSGVDSNCSGKSLIGDILTDLFFDKTIRRHSQKNFIGEWKKWCLTKITLGDTLTGDRYSIIKYRNHPTHNDKVFFIKNTTVNLSKKTKADTYKVIAKVFGINWSTFKNRNFFGQDDDGRFLRVTDSKKADIIIDIQDLHDLQESQKKAKKNMKEVKLKLLIGETKLGSAREKMEFIEKFEKEEKERNEKDLSNARVSLKRIRSEIEEKEKKINAFEDVDELLQEMLDRLVELEKKIKSLKKLEDDFVSKKTDAFLVNKDLNYQVTRLEEKEILIFDLKKEISNLKKEKDDSCKLCGASLDSKRKAHAIKVTALELVAQEKLAQKIRVNITKLSKKQTVTMQKLKDLQEKIDKLSPYKKKMKALEKKRAAVGETKLDYFKLELSLKELNKALKGTLREYKNLRTSNVLSKYKEEKEATENDLAYYKKQIKELLTQRRKNEFSAVVFEKTIRNIFNDFLKDLNYSANDLLGMLCDNDIDVTFTGETERASKKVVDQISVRISVDGTEPRDFRTYSGGEKGRVELVTQLALFLSGDSNFPLLFLDEPFVGIDKSGRERIINLLQDVAEKGSRVFVVSNKVVPTGYGTVINVTRKDGKSEINYEK